MSDYTFGTGVFVFSVLDTAQVLNLYALQRKLPGFAVQGVE